MADDIVTHLRAAARTGDLPLGSSFDCDAVADEIMQLREELDAEGNWGNLLAVEIKRLQAENERLRAGGDALEHSLLMWQSKHPHLDLGYDALAAWQEARRG